MIKALIIEDETAAAVNLTAILRHVAKDVELLATLESVEESVDWLKSNPMPDLIFMDIHLADGDSFRIFKEVDITAPIIFTTAYDQYALDAFKVNSIDYLLKPIAEEDVVRALGKLGRLTNVERKEYKARVTKVIETRQEEVQQQVFLVHQRDKIIPLRCENIAYCYTRDERVVACDVKGNIYNMDKTLEALQALLSPKDFFRANRQFIISRSAIKDISVWFGSRLTLSLVVDLPERIVISKARVPEFKQWLMEVHPQD